MSVFDTVMHALGTWEWWAIGGIVLLIAEIFLSGAFLLWPGLAALVVAGLALLAAPDPQVNLVVFAALSLLSAYFWRSTYLGRNEQNDQPALNQRGQQLVGRICVLVTETSEAQGRVQVGDTTWSARTAPGNGLLRAGTRVRVVTTEGTVLIVAPEEAL